MKIIETIFWSILGGGIGVGFMYIINWVNSPRKKFKIKNYWIVGYDGLMDSNTINKLLKYKDQLEKERKLSSLSKFNFHYVNTKDTKGSVSEGIWINEIEKIVVKIPYLIDHVTPKRAIPTLIIEMYSPFEIDNHKYNQIFIQPLADTSNPIKVREYLEDLGLHSLDCHKGNVGMYNNIEVQFDW